MAFSISFESETGKKITDKFDELNPVGVGWGILDHYEITQTCPTAPHKRGIFRSLRNDPFLVSLLP